MPFTVLTLLHFPPFWWQIYPSYCTWWSEGKHPSKKQTDKLFTCAVTHIPFVSGRFLLLDWQPRHLVWQPYVKSDANSHATKLCFTQPQIPASRWSWSKSQETHTYTHLQTVLHQWEQCKSPLTLGIKLNSAESLRYNNTTWIGAETWFFLSLC